MLRHLLKLNWNKKRQNFLLIIEVFLCFIVLFAVFTTIIHFRKNYNQSAGFEYKNKIAVNFINPWANTAADSSRLYFQNIASQLYAVPGVEKVSLFASNYPYSNISFKKMIRSDNDEVYAIPYIVDSGFLQVLKLQLISGRWFNSIDPAAKLRPVVISESLQSILFPGNNAVGNTFSEQDMLLKVVGVVGDFKDEGDFKSAEPKYFLLADSTAAQQTTSSILISYSPESEASIEPAVFKTLQNAVENRDIKIDYLNHLRERRNNMTIVPVLVLIMIAAFLVFNVSLGLFGILWFNISKRRGEIALRIAVGANKGQILLQIIGEVFVLSSFALLPGSLFAVQFPLLNVFNLPGDTYLLAYLFSLASIYLITIACAVYPGYLATRVYPAIALHEE